MAAPATISSQIACDVSAWKRSKPFFQLDAEITAALAANAFDLASVKRMRAKVSQKYTEVLEKKKH